MGNGNQTDSEKDRFPRSRVEQEIFYLVAYLWKKRGEGKEKKEDTSRELLQPGGCNLPVFVSLVRLPITVTEK